MKNRNRIVALLMVVAIVLTIFSGVVGMAMSVKAAGRTPEIDESSIKVYHLNGNEVSAGRLSTSSGNYDVKFRYRDSSLTSSDAGTVKDINFTLGGTSGFQNGNAGNSTLRLQVVDDITDIYVEVELNNVKYTGNSGVSIAIKAATLANGNTYASERDGNQVNLLFDIPDIYLPGSSGGSSGGSDYDSETYTSDIVVENVIVRDREGNQINSPITKDSPEFDLEIIYTDLGENMDRVDRDDFKESTIQGYLTNAGGFTPNATNRGSVSVLTTSGDYPRFMVRFTNLTFNEGGSPDVGFRIQYMIDDQPVNGSATATVHQAKDEEEDDEIDPLTPYIIVTQYSYGGEPIEAGDTFSLHITYQNTSADIDLANIVMTVNPDTKGLNIASASNTFFIDGLGAGAARSATIELQAKPAAEVLSYEVEIQFTYQYIAKKELKDGEKTEKIAVPVTQLDRFEVDDITEMSDAVTVGDEGYATVVFTNKGQSTTYNISGIVSGNLEIIAPNAHFGNLEAGKNDSIDVTFIPQEPGDFYGEVTITYEDENRRQNSIVKSFTAYVEEPYVPPAFDPDMMGEDPYGEEQAGASPLTVVLCIIGGLLLAGPIALYLMKRVKVKGSEDFDEDF